MSAASIILTELQALVAANPTLSAVMPVGYLQLGIPLSYPSICVDGIVAQNDKQEIYNFNVNLWLAGSSDITDKLAFYELADALKAVITSSNLILGGDYLDRSETNATGKISSLRVMFPCSAYLAGQISA